MPPYRCALEEPRRSTRGVQAVRPKADRLQGAADRAGLDQLAGVDGGSILEALAVADGIDAPRLALDLARLRQLVERGEPGFVAEVILAVAHGRDAQSSAFV